MPTDELTILNRMPGKMIEFMKGAHPQIIITTPRIIVKQDPFDLPVSDYEDGKAELVAYKPAKYLGITQEQLDDLDSTTRHHTLSKHLNCVLLAVVPNHAVRALAMIMDNSPDVQNKIIFKPGGMIRYLAGMNLQVTHLEFWFHNGFGAIAKKLQGAKEETTDCPYRVTGAIAEQFT